ncbi:hypothetical protein [Bradyrhizobium sp. JR3.5]
MLAFIHNDVGSIPSSKTDLEPELQQKLSAFRKAVSKSRLVVFWSSRDDLKAKVIISLHKAMSDYPSVGWMRADVAASEDLLSQMNQLRLQNDELRSKAAPRFEGADMLADIDSKVVVRYTHAVWSSQTSRYNNVPAQFSVDWKSLFVLIGPQFVAPRSTIDVAMFIHVLQENALIPSAREGVQLFTSDLNVIDAQLQAYGLISSELAGTVSGGVGRFMELTPLGRRRLLEWSTVKSSEGPLS